MSESITHSLTHNAHAQHPDHQAREPLLVSKSCCWEAGRRRGRLLTGGGPGAPCATVYDALCFACRVLKIMLKIGGTGRGERRSSRRSARRCSIHGPTRHTDDCGTTTYNQHNHRKPRQMQHPREAKRSCWTTSSDWLSKSAHRSGVNSHGREPRQARARAGQHTVRVQRALCDNGTGSAPRNPIVKLGRKSPSGGNPQRDQGGVSIGVSSATAAGS